MSGLGRDPIEGGTELSADVTRSTDPNVTWEVVGRSGAAFTTYFDYHSDR